MHIALVANSTWNIVNFRKPVIDALLTEGHTITVLAPPDQYVSQLGGVPRLRFESLNSLDRQSTDLFTNMRLYVELRSKYKQIKPDLILHYTAKPNIFGTLAAWPLGIRSIMVVTGLGYAFLHGGLTNRLARVAYYLASKKAQAVVFENEDDLRMFEREGFLNRVQGLAVPGCGVDITYFQPRAKSRENSTLRVFTFVGRLLKDKGIHEFIEAAKQVHQRYPNTRFRIVGNLDEANPARIGREELAAWMRIPGVEYAGFSDDIRQLYADTDWVVLPSYREGMSRVLLESLSMGRPMITTDTPGCRETVQPGKNGFLVPVRDARALAIAIETAVNMSEQEWSAFCAFSRRKAVMEFETTLVADFYVDLVRNLVGNPLGRSHAAHNHQENKS